MLLLGAHMSIAGGYHKALLAAQEKQCNTVQLFTKNTNQWNAKEISKDEAELFRKTLRQTRLRYPMAHDSYLINLASPDRDLYRRSIEAFVLELRRAESLGLTYLVTHPGSHMGAGEEAGLARVAAAIDETHRRCRSAHTRILLETTAGQGTNLGNRFEHLARIFAHVREPARLGVCFDTCHVFAAGYDLSPARNYHATMRAFGKAIGLSRLCAFHLNDSQKCLGSRVDRHAHIGRGQMGIEPFRLLLRDPRFRSRPMILETPKSEGDDTDMDTVNLRVLRQLAANA